MAKEVTTARENGVMGLRSRNAIGGRTDRAHGRATYPSLNKTTQERVRSGEWAPQDKRPIEFGNGVSARELGKSYELRESSREEGDFYRYFDHTSLNAREVWNNVVKEANRLVRIKKGR